MPSGPHSIAGLLAPDRVRVGLAVGSKESLIEELVQLLDGAPGIDNLDAVRADVFRRERQLSTGIGKGLALPHARTDAVGETVASFATTSTPVEYDSVDEQPVRFALMMVGPTHEKARHVALLGQISRLVTRADFIESILKAPDPNAVIDLFQRTQRFS